MAPRQGYIISHSWIYCRLAESFESIVNDKGFKGVFDELGGDRLKVAPKGYPKDHPQIEWLRYKDFIVSKKIPNRDFQSDQILDISHDVYHQMADFITYLRKAIGQL